MIPKLGAQDGPIRVVAGIVTFNNAATILPCLEALPEAASGVEMEVRITDNGSTDGTPERVRERFPSLDLRQTERNIGFGAAQNRMLRDSGGSHVLVLNPDARLAPGSIRQLIGSLAAESATALVGPRLDYPDGRPQVNFGVFPGWLNDWRQRLRVRGVQRRRRSAIRRLEHRLREPFHPDWVSGSCFLIRTEPWDALRGFDERFFLYLEDVDLCLRLRRAGSRVKIDPRARGTHVEGSSLTDAASRTAYFRQSRLLYERLHGTALGAHLYRQLRLPRK